MPISVSQYSANITDWGASIDEVNNAPIINEMIQSGITHIKVPAGRFRITETIVIDQDNVVIEGTGPASIIEITTGDDVAFDFNGGSALTRIVGCQIRNLWIRGESFAGAAVEPTSTATGVGIMARHVVDFLVDRCTVTHHSGYSVRVEFARHVTISDSVCWLNNWNIAWAATTADLFIGDDVEGLNITRNRLLSNNKLGLYLTSENNSASVIVDDNIIIPCDADGNVLADGSVNRIHGINYFYVSANGVVGDQDRKIISHNVIHKTKWTAIYGSGQVGDDADSGSRIVISNNFCSKNGLDYGSGDDTLQGAIVALGGREARIVDNVIVDYRGYTSSDGGYDAYGAINVYQQNSGCTVVVDNNTIKNTRAKAIYIGGKAAKVKCTGNYITGQGYFNLEGNTAIAIYTRVTLRSDVTGVTVSSTDTFTKTTHGLTDGMRVAFGTGAEAQGVNDNKTYYVYNSDANTFQIVEEQGSTTVITGLTPGGSFTVTDPTDLGGHDISNNHVECWAGAISIDIMNSGATTANETAPSKIENNTLINRRYTDKAGTGVSLLRDVPVVVRGNTLENFNIGVNYSTAPTGRRVDQVVIDDNHFTNCSASIQCNNDGSGNGLIICCNNTFVNCVARIYTTGTQALVEGVRKGNGNIEAWHTAIPTFGTWAQYDVVTNRTWTSDSDVVEWVKTDAGTDLYSAATFTPRMVGGGGSGYTMYDAGSSGATKTIDWATNGGMQKMLLTADCTLDMTAPATTMIVYLKVTQDSVVRTLTPSGTLDTKMQDPFWVPTSIDGESTIYAWLYDAVDDMYYLLPNCVPAWGA